MIRKKTKDFQGYSDLIHFVLRVLYAVFIMVWFVDYFLTNGIIKKAEEEIGVFKESTTVVKAIVDNRRKNVFYSTPDFFRQLTNMNKNVTAVVKGTAELVIINKMSQFQNNVRKEVNVMFTTETFFEKINGKLTWGKTFTRSDFNLGRPVAVIGAGLAKQLFGRGYRSIKSIALNNYDYDLVGEWEFINHNTTENHSVIIPITTMSHLGNAEKTYINTFIFRGDKIDELEALKRSIDQIQLQSGYVPTRPEFNTISLQVDVDNRKIWYSKRFIINILCWILAVLIIVLGSLYTAIFYKTSIASATWRLLAGMSSKEICLDYSKAYRSVFFKIILSSSFVVILIIMFFNYLYNYNFSFGSSFNYSIFLVLLTPIIFTFLYENVLNNNLKIDQQII